MIPYNIFLDTWPCNVKVMRYWELLLSCNGYPIQRLKRIREGNILWNILKFSSFHFQKLGWKLISDMPNCSIRNVSQKNQNVDGTSYEQAKFQNINNQVCQKLSLRYHFNFNIRSMKSGKPLQKLFYFLKICNKFDNWANFTELMLNAPKKLCMFKLLFILFMRNNTFHWKFAYLNGSCKLQVHIENSDDDNDDNSDDNDDEGEEEDSDRTQTDHSNDEHVNFSYFLPFLFLNCFFFFLHWKMKAIESSMRRWEAHFWNI